MCAHVLVAEDDPRQAEVVRRYLVADGHEASVVHDGEAALAEARRLHPDLLVLDVMMPGVNGHQVCRAVRAESDVLVMMLTARTTEAELLLGLGVGADDYLTKPYSPRELIARIRTLLRRATRSAAGTPAAALHRVGRIGLDPLRHTVTVDGEPVECTPGEFAILAAMSAQPGRAFTRGQLLHHTRGIDRSSTERTIDAHVMNLRRKTELSGLLRSARRSSRSRSRPGHIFRAVRRRHPVGRCLVRRYPGHVMPGESTSSPAPAVCRPRAPFSPYACPTERCRARPLISRCGRSRNPTGPRTRNALCRGAGGGRQVGR